MAVTTRARRLTSWRLAAVALIGGVGLLAARGESLAAFDGRCILAGCVAPPSNIPDILGRRALPARRLARLSATPDFHHGLLAADQAPPRPPLVIASLDGHDLYRFYCAPCHGRDGKGGGPVAGSLTTAPPDLTTIARRHGGVFSRARVTSFVTHDGDALAPAHGSKDMPVWGPIFLGLDPSDTMTSIRIENLVDAIGSMQVK